jgi:hypothetical protein
MHQIQLNDELYKEALRRATEAGFASVEEYIADVLSQELHDATENLDHLFTPEAIAELDQISDQIKAGGKTYSAEEVEQHFEKKREEWLRKHAG